MIPTISTERLVLRHIKKGYQRQLSWLRDPEVVRYSEQRHHEHTLSTQMAYMESFVDKSYLWGIFRLKDDEHIGNVTATHDGPNNVSDIGIMIGDTLSWGKGYGREAWKAACDYLIGHGQVRKLEAGCMATNEAMVKIITSTGFQQEGIRANHFLAPGPVHMLLFGRHR